MWRKRPFTATGVLTTIVGILVLMLDWRPGFSHGVAWIGASPAALLFTFPLCGLVWEWPPKPSSASSILLFVAILAHWPLIGFWADRRVSRRESARIDSPPNSSQEATSRDQSNRES